jgi:ribosomal protein S14
MASSRQQASATRCEECGKKAVFFNEFNVSVSCHACGREEADVDVRRVHLEIWRQEEEDG